MPQAVFLLALCYAAFLGAGVSGQPPSSGPATILPEPEPNNCPDQCGGVHIPYPFGIGPGCFLADDFELTCNETTNPPRPFTGNVRIANITLETARMVVYSDLTYSCNVSTGSTRQTSTYGMFLSLPPTFLVSPSENVFTAIGCNSVATLNGHTNTTYLTGCITTCASVNDTGNDGTPCSGHGYCEASITPKLSEIIVAWQENGNAVPGNPCQYSFVATKGWYGTIFCLAILVLLLIYLRYQQQKRKLIDRFNKNGGQLLESIKIEIFSKKELKNITKDYSSPLGKGAFGEVFEGNIGDSDSTRVAVKRSMLPGKAITEDVQRESFANEIKIQFQINHRNVVQLRGCCLETEVPMLVYEFVPRGSLHDVLHDKKDPLPLETRLDIAIDSAVALVYMHSEASQKILHGDVKSGNILLDDKFMPKVSDFGTSRFLSFDKDHTNMVIGDMSYIDPVYTKTGLLTEKSDVYSFGIVLLELVTRKEARYDGNNSLPMNYLKASRDGTTRQIIDKEVADHGEECVDCLEEIGRIAMQCLNDEVDDRPTMSDVADRLKLCKSRWIECHGKTSESCM
ncbi:unnamed protein product [Alopecurus aequalis]